jgi:hypothetical protein
LFVDWAPVDAISQMLNDAILHQLEVRLSVQSRIDIWQLSLVIFDYLQYINRNLNKYKSIGILTYRKQSVNKFLTGLIM